MKSLDDMTEPELRDTMNSVCKAIQDALPPDTGFIVLACPVGGPVAQYAGNVDRQTGSDWIKETLERWGTDDFVTRSAS